MSSLDLWAMSWETWAILALLSVIVDIVVGASGNIVACGFACILMSLLAVFSNFTGILLIPGWKVAGIEFSVFSLFAVLLLRLLRKRQSRQDINIY